MQFDYYAATLPCSLSHCKSSILSSFPGVFLDEKPVRPYSHGLLHPDRGFRVYHGGTNPLPFFVSTGSDAEAGADFVRQHYPEHRVSRADVAHDFVSPGGFDRAVRILDPIARAAGVAVTFLGDPAPGQKTGRTMYFGSPKSDVRLCVYEKGLHERGKGRKSAAGDWFRIELRVRPRKDRKALTARLSGAEMWGLSRWTMKAAQQVLDLAPVHMPDATLRKSSADKAIDHMLKQYAQALRAFIDQHGRQHFDDRIDEILADE